jgi:hypothetical protein
LETVIRRCRCSKATVEIFVSPLMLREQGRAAAGEEERVTMREEEQSRRLRRGAVAS